MPHDADPERFASLLIEFCATTEPARLTADHWTTAIRSRR